MNTENAYDVEMEMGNGDVFKMKVTLSEDWSEIEKGTKALLNLVNGQLMLVEIVEANEDEGVSFKTMESDRSWHYDGNLVREILVEVKE